MNEKEDLELNMKEIKAALACYRAINHRLRVQILQLIHKEKKINVTTIYQKLNLVQSVASQHLAILRRAGFIDFSRDHQSVYYFVCYDKIKRLHSISPSLVKQ